MRPDHLLEARGLTLGYDTTPVVHEVDLVLPAGRITAIIGANASGKSTLLRGFARLLEPRAGVVLLDGEPLHRMRPGDVARVLGMLPQAPVAPDGITVADLVGRGRHPHQGWFRRWSAADDAAVDAALHATATADLVDRPVAELSGGQRQRVWIAMALAQQTGILLLDEPTTFLDLNHQIELLDLLVDLNRQRGTTIVLVLHELNLAARYADLLVAMRSGRIVDAGPPAQVVTAATVRDVFDLRCDVIPDPRTGAPMVIPIGRHAPSTTG
ncbi:ABC transporter ATP-binding protein [Occultella glacieicola]|uniref:ABC transporter ATP-binding protein n=1 Tax=Occultella glacieicola TaxID=2518684 RepID=A0ABY2E707_9MICO|nr:ABC transporter ATP-binding protein [Occultella glacieicola]TDE97336.1 ABC transporter ATP-binding protein [Occultella glacieicola]